MDAEELAVTVKYRTREGTAKAKTDFEPMDGTLEFAPGETEKNITMKIIDDATYEEDEDFFVDLYEVSAKNDAAVIGEIGTCTIVIIDDDEPGKLKFEKDSIEVDEPAEDLEVHITVERFNGSTG